MDARGAPCRGVVVREPLWPRRGARPVTLGYLPAQRKPWNRELGYGWVSRDRHASVCGPASGILGAPPPNHGRGARHGSARRPARGQASAAALLFTPALAVSRGPP